MAKALAKELASELLHSTMETRDPSALQSAIKSVQGVEGLDEELLMVIDSI